MYSRVNYTIVGIFVLLFGIGLVAFAFWLAKYGLHQEYDLYKTYMKESVSGLSKDSVVRLHGVEVGRVREIRIDPNDIEHVEIILAIRHGIPIKEDMIVHTSMLGVTGLLAIEIEGGSNRAKTLHPSKEYIPVIRSSASWFDKTKQDISTLAARLAHLFRQSEKLLSDQNLETFGQILKHTEEVSRKSTSVMDEVNATLVTYKVAIGKINKDFSRAVQDFSGIAKESVPAVHKIKEAARSFNRVTMKVEKGLDRGDYNIKKILEPLLVNIEILSDQLNAMAKELEESPSDIFFKARKARRGPEE